MGLRKHYFVGSELKNAEEAVEVHNAAVTGEMKEAGLNLELEGGVFQEADRKDLYGLKYDEYIEINDVQQDDVDTETHTGTEVVETKHFGEGDALTSQIKNGEFREEI